MLEFYSIRWYFWVFIFFFLQRPLHCIFLYAFYAESILTDIQVDTKMFCLCPGLAENMYFDTGKVSWVCVPLNCHVWFSFLLSKINSNYPIFTFSISRNVIIIVASSNPHYSCSFWFWGGIQICHGFFYLFHILLKKLTWPN